MGRSIEQRSKIGEEMRAMATWARRGAVAALLLWALRQIKRWARGAAARGGRPAIPGGALPGLGHGAAFLTNSLQLLLGSHRTLGDVFTLLLPSDVMHFVCRMDQAVDLLSSKNEALGFEDFLVHFNRKMFGASERCAKFQALNGRFYHPTTLSEAALRNTCADFSRFVSQRLWYVSEGGEQVDLFPFVFHVFAAGTIAAHWSEKLARELDDGFLDDWLLIDQRFGALGQDVPLVAADGHRAVERMLRKLTEWDTDRLADLTPGRVGHAIHLAQNKHGHKAFARDAACHGAFFLAASTVNGPRLMVWALLHILNNKEAREAVLAEVRAVPLGPEGEVAYEAVAGLTVLSACLEETMRMYTGNSIFRMASEDTELSFRDPHTRPIEVRKGEMIVFNSQAHNYNSGIFEDPHRWDFRRFLPADGASGKPKFTAPDGSPLQHQHLFFGWGKHMCPGRKFFDIEAKVLLVHLMQGFEVEVPSNIPSPNWLKSMPGAICPPFGITTRLEKRPA